MALREKLQKSFWFLSQFYLDRLVYFKNCGISPFRDKDKSLYYKIIIETHSLEKGLSVAHTRPGFGKAKIRYVLDALKQYDISYSPLPASMALGTLEAYADFHDKIGFTSPLIEELKNFTEAYRDKVVADGGLRRFGGNMALGSHQMGEAVLTTRFSSRVFSPEPLSRSEIEHVVQVAQQAPSQCNRQATKAYFFQDRAKIDELLALQAGAGGFSQDVSNLFVVTSEIAAWGGAQQRNQPYVDGALFSMNLLLACHANDIASCPLNLAVTHAAADKIKAAAGISAGEILIMMIAVGRLPSGLETLEAARSPRRPISEVLRFWPEAQP